MDSTALHLPPLPAIRVFEAVARHLSFTKAAAELGVTQAAVSYQIKLLEDRIGTALFRRLTRKLALTETGLRLAPSVNSALGHLAEAFATVRMAESSALRITAVPSFASNWLVQRLDRFTRTYPQYNVCLDSLTSTVDPLAEEFDIRILYGQGEWSGHVAEKLMRVGATPMVSPTLLASIGGAENPLDLLKLTLFQEGGTVWEKWFALSGNKVPPSIAWGPQLDTQQIRGRAAVQGQGVALLMPPLFTDDVAAGRLVQPFPQLLFWPGDYYLAYSKSRQHLPKIQAFRSWILGELAADGRPGCTLPTMR